jgi:hypothetical protein
MLLAVPMATFETVCDVFARQARYCDEHGSVFTARLLRGLIRAIREEAPILQTVATWQGDPMNDALPLRVAGALHALVLDGDAPELARHYPGGDREGDEPGLQLAAVDALTSHAHVLSDYLASPPQTNEVGRSAVLLGGFMAIAAQTGLPLRLFELGASAGLNMNWDRYRYCLDNEVMGDASSSLTLTPIWQGELPPAVLPEVVARAACDRSPIDLSSAAQRRRLRAYVWADQSSRLQQLNAALDVAARHPVHVEQADAPEWTEHMLAAPLPEGVATVIYHTIFWTYLPAEAQARIESAIRKAGQAATVSAPLAWLRLELSDFHSHPRLLLSLWPGPQNLHLADAQAHGNAIFWHAAALGDALIYSTYPSPPCMRASLCPSGEGRLAVCRDTGAQRGAHTGRPQHAELEDGVTSRRPAGCAARLEQTASLPCASRHTLRAFWTSCRVRGIDQSIPKRVGAYCAATWPGHHITYN